MTRTLFGVFALALSAWQSGYENGAWAQQTAEGTVEADASADQSGQASADASANQSAEADANTSSQSSSAAESGQAATSDETSANQSGTSTPSDSTQSALPPPTDDSNRQSGTSSQYQSQQDQPARANQDASATSRDANRADTSTSVRGRDDAESDVRRGDRSRDVRAGIRFGRATDRGLVIDTVEPNSVFVRAGLRRGDIIVSIGSRPIRSEDDFVRFVRVHRGNRIPVVVWRDGREETVYVMYDDRVVADERPLVDREASAVGGRPFFGVVFDGRIRDAAVVQSVTPGSPAEEAGLQSGDELVAINGERLYSYRDAIDVIRSTQPGDKIDIDFARRMTTQAVIDSQPGAPLRTAANPDVQVERQVVPVPMDREPSIEVRRDYRDRDTEGYDRDDDERGLRGRGLFRGRN